MADIAFQYEQRIQHSNTPNMDTFFEEEQPIVRRHGFLEGVDSVKVLIGVALTALLACVVYLFYTMEVEAIYYTALLWILSVIALLWGGNLLIAKRLNRSYPWAAYPSKRFFIQLVYSTLYSLLCVNGTYYLFKVLFTKYPPEFEQIILLNVYGLLFTIPIISINFGIYFLMQWKKAFVQSENLKREQIKTQFESLKNHIDPHFLFNNLNILSSLIEKENYTAQNFLESFSDVYRYVLQNKSAELVKVEKELEFMDAYFHMLKQRFRGNLCLSVEVDERLTKKMIPPLSLQMLIENIVKHNVISDDKNLEVRVYCEDDEFLCVTNTLQRKTSSYSSQSGLNNISKRYNYLSNQTIKVIDDGQTFTVKLPLLSLDLY